MLLYLKYEVIFFSYIFFLFYSTQHKIKYYANLLQLQEMFKIASNVVIFQKCHIKPLNDTNLTYSANHLCFLVGHYGANSEWLRFQGFVQY